MTKQQIRQLKAIITIVTVVHVSTSKKKFFEQEVNTRFVVSCHKQADLRSKLDMANLLALLPIYTSSRPEATLAFI